MKESRDDRFHRLAEARVNKIIKMIRLLGNCSKKSVYQYDAGQVDQIFSALQTELDTARRRFYMGKQRFSLSAPYCHRREMLANPHISLSLPNGGSLMAVAFQQENYPSIDVYFCRNGEEPELICFAEYNQERSPCHEVCVGAYQSDEDETKYYEPYVAERKSDEEMDILPHAQDSLA